MASSVSRQRFWAVSFLVVSLFVIVVYQLLQLTVIRRQAFLQLADRQHQLRIEIPPLRGQILDRHGKELATNLKVPSVYAIPRLLVEEDKLPLAHQISKILGLDLEFVMARLKRDKSFVWLKRQASYDEAEKIKALESS